MKPQGKPLRLFRFLYTWLPDDFRKGYFFALTSGYPDTM